MLVCEDAWHSLAPTLAALDGAQVILVHSATPARGLAPRAAGSRPSNLDRWDRLAQGISEEHGVFVIVSHLVGFEGGKGFAGGSIASGPRGNILVEAPVFEPATVPLSLDLDEITRARAEAPLLSDLQARLPHLLDGWSAGRLGGSAMPDSARAVAPSRRAVAPSRRAAEPPSSGVDPLLIDPVLTHRWLVEFIRDEMVRRRKFTKAVIGLSGGVDSALVTFLAVEALGRENVTAVRMPYRTSSPESLEHAGLVIEELGVPSRTVDISAGVDGIVTAIGSETPSRKGNVMARMRMITLFDLSAELNALPLGTGNKTERLLGYFTWHADDSPPVNPIGDLFKTQVWALARHVGVPEVIVKKPASADLIKGQTDEGDFGISYPKADLILHWLLQGYGEEEIIPQGFTAGEIKLVRTRLESTHWKRRLPTVAMLSQTAIGEYYLRPVDF
jgi:NAD+ synthetase